MKRALAVVVLVCATAACASLSSAPRESSADARFIAEGGPDPYAGNQSAR